MQISRRSHVAQRGMDPVQGLFQCDVCLSATQQLNKILTEFSNRSLLLQNLWREMRRFQVTFVDSVPDRLSLVIRALSVELDIFRDQALSLSSDSQPKG